MTATTQEKYDAGTSEADFATAEDPPEDETPGEGTPPAGWTRDRSTGEMRPKRRAGRPRLGEPPEPALPSEPVSRTEDQPPGPPAGRRRRPKDSPGPDPAMPKGGVIAAGVNKLYRRAGKLIRAADRDIGQAIIDCTRPDPEEPDELTVGEAWENLCKTNPRIRRFVLKAIAGGAVGDLLMAHAPIGIALVMKPWVQKLIPFGRIVESMAEPDEDTPEGEGGLPGGMTEADVGDMRDLAEQQARRMAARMGINVTAEELTKASAAAAARMPAGFVRQQPRRASRAQRRGAPG